MENSGAEGVSLDLLLPKVSSIVSGAGARDDKLASVCRLLRENVPHYNWVGFYFVSPTSSRELLLGPYAGAPTEHTRIPFGKGICGQVAESQETRVVQDVAAEENYLSCSVEVKSEIVVPVLAGGLFVAELDIDSYHTAPFTDADVTFLERACEIVSGLFAN